MDVVYILSYDPTDNYSELRFSLRSLSRYCNDVDDLYIVGNKPSWIKNVKHIPVEDRYYPWGNHLIKVLTAFKHTDNFLLLNDDFYMLAPFSAGKYPYFDRGKICGTGQTNYNKILLKTSEYLQKRGLNTLHYGVHCPIRYESDFLSIADIMLQKLDDEIGYSPRCIYGNMLNKKSVEIKDTKCYDNLKLENNPCGCVSSGDRCDIGILAEVFNEISKWE